MRARWAISLTALLFVLGASRMAAAAPQLIFSPTSQNVGNVKVGTSGNTTIVGTAMSGTITVTSFTTSGTRCADYSVSPDPGTGPITIPSGNQVTFTITFTPSAAGAGNCTFTSVDNGAGSPSFTISGTGTTAIMSLTPSPLAFGNVHVGGVANQTLAVNNTGTATLTVASLAISGANAADFAFTDHACTGQSCTPIPITITPTAHENFAIRCAPASTGSRTATLTVLGDQNSGTNTVNLTCTGTSPVAVISPTLLTFADTVVGNSRNLTVTVQNTASGGSAENLSYTIAKSGANAALFTVSAACTTPCTVTPGSSATETITFSPTSRGNFSASLTFTTNDPANPSVVVNLSGAGIAPVVGNPQPNPVAFGNVDVGATSTGISASITNTGDAQLNISSVSIATGASDFSITAGTTTASTVAAASSESWTITCHPSATGARSGTLRIVSDGLGTSPFDLSLTCTGQQAIFSFSPPTGLDFGAVFVGNSSTLPVTISNTGNKSGQVTAITSGNAAFTFAVVGGSPPRTIAAGGNIQVNATFTPVNGNNINTSLTVTTDGSPGSFTIPLHGDGQTQGVDIAVTGEASLDVDLGDSRVGVAVSKQVVVTNSGDTPFTLALPSSNSARCVVQLVNPVTYPASLAAGATAVFNVNVTPSVVGGATCDVSVVSNVPTNDTIHFAFNGVAPDVAVLSGGTLAFDDVDVDATPPTASVVVQNTGGFPLTISACSVTGSAAFTVVTPCGSPIVIPVGAMTSIDVQYDPGVEALDDGVLTLSVDALSTNTVVVELSGVGTDQRIQLDKLSLQFPDTFRNPANPPVMTVTVTNPVNATTGEGSPLTISMASDDLPDIFQVDPGPFTIAPGDDLALDVAFAPDMADASYDGTLTILNDTTAEPMAQVQLAGRGIARDVVPIDGTIDLGDVPVGVAIDLAPYGISLTNRNGTTFVVSGVDVQDADGNDVGDGVARVEIAGNQPLPANGATNLEGDFIAGTSGAFDYDLVVYLDGDPVPQGRVHVVGNGVERTTYYGCNAAGRGDGWLVILCGLFALRRRRRPR